MSNGCPLWFFEKCFNKFNEKFLHSHSACSGHIYNRDILYLAMNPDSLSINYKTLSTLNLN